jgi:predicted DNA-binding transcriptional regulator AlpA
MPSPVTIFNLPDGTYVDLTCELQDGQRPVVARWVDDGKRVEALASPAQAAGCLADFMQREGADDLAAAFRRAAQQAMRLRVVRRRQPGYAAATARTARQRAAAHARKLTAAVAKGPAAVAELLGCPGDTDAMYTAAFHAAVNRLHDLLSVIERLAHPGDGLKEWSNADELCTWLGIAKETIHSWNTTGQGPRRHRLGNENRYHRDDVEEWLVTRAIAAGRKNLKS